MKIVDLHRRRKSLYGVEFNEIIQPKLYGAETDPVGYIALDTEVCDLNGITVGTELTEQQLESLVEESNYVRAKRRGLWYLEQKDMSKKELVEKLTKAFSKSAAQKVADRFEELQLINDEKYAERLAEQLVFCKKTSPSHAAFVLTTKGINRETAKAVAEKINVDSAELIKDIIDKRYKNRLNDQKEINRAIGYLARRGFSVSEIKSALREYNNNNYFED